MPAGPRFWQAAPFRQIITNGRRRPLRSIRQTALAVPHRIEDVVDIRVERFHGFYCGCRLSVTVPAERGFMRWSVPSRRTN